MSEITYGQIFQKFRAQFPNVEVDDYRPSTISCAIIVWTKDNRRLLYHYEPGFDVGFVIAEVTLGESSEAKARAIHSFCSDSIQ